MSHAIRWIFLVAAGVGIARAQTPAPPAIDPKADAILRKMSATLAGAERLTVESEETIDQFSNSGQKVQLGKHVAIAARRPGEFAADVDGDDEKVRFVLRDGKIGIINHLEKCYATADVPRTIDAAFDLLAEKYGMTTPLCDLLFADPYKVLTERVRSGEYLGMHRVMGQKCHHLAFRQDGIDWQIWIEDSERALPRKLVITHKELPGYPQFTALLDKWNLAPQIPDAAFEFSPPPGMNKIDLVPVDKADESRR
jgi:hypothetical protein